MFQVYFVNSYLSLAINITGSSDKVHTDWEVRNIRNLVSAMLIYYHRCRYLDLIRALLENSLEQTLTALALHAYNTNLNPLLVL